MKNFTFLIKLMVVLLIVLSPSVTLFAQVKSAAEKAPDKTHQQEVLLKMLDDKGFTVKDIPDGVSMEEFLVGNDKFLKQQNSEDNSQYAVTGPSTFVPKTKNVDGSITVTLGTGTSTNTTTGNPTPYGTFYKNFRQQYLILQSELVPLTIGAGDITEIGFEVANLNTCVDMPDFTISIKQTTASVLTTTFDNTGFTEVFYLSTFLPTVGWNMHTFDTPFTWDGTSNLIIDICTSIIPGAYTQNASVYYTPTTYNSCARYQSDTQPACLTTNAGTVSANRANMKITGEELLNPPPGPPFNEDPANGAIDVAIAGDLTWSFGNNTDTYDVFLGPSGAMVKVVDNQPATGPDSLYSYSGLSYATAYQWQIVVHNVNGTTNGPVWNFSTSCATVTAPFQYHFDTQVIPNCWSISGPQNWLFTNTWPGYGAAGITDHTGNSGSIAGVDGSGTAGLTGITLTTPPIDVSPLTTPQLRFYLFNNNTNDASYQTLSVDLWDGAQWNDGIYFWGPTDNDSSWVEATVILSAYNITGDIQLRFVVDKSTGSPFYDDLIIDDIFVEEAPTCPAPALLGATAISNNSADLTWTSFSGLSDIEFGPAGFVPTGTPTYAGVVSPYTVSGLTSLTDYSFYVRDDCGGGDYSLWVGPYSFTTQPSCPEPYDLGATNITMTSADLEWSSFTNISDIEFGPGGFVPTGTPTYTSVTSPYNVSGLNTAAPYDFYVRDDCGGGDYSEWAGPFTFLTSPGSQTIPVFEDFESGFTYFNNAAGNNVDWSFDNTLYYSGAQSALNVYGNTNTNILHETGVIDLSSAAIVFLEFWQIAKTEGDFDHCYVEISIDGGATYTPLPESTYTGAGIYEPALYNTPSGPCFDEDSYTIWGTAAATPDNTWWQHEVFDLSDYLVPNVRIRFRLHSDGSIQRYGWLLDDILIYEPAYGTLEGTVTESGTNLPIDGATISVQGGYSGTSGSDGTYSIPGILTGDWMAVCTAPGHNPDTADITIQENVITTQDFQLTYPTFTVTPTAVYDTLEPNGMDTKSITLENAGNGPVDWNAMLVLLGDDNGSDDAWDLQFQFDVEAATGALGNAGAECDGQYYYTTRWASNLIHKYDLTGMMLEEFSIPGVSGLRDLAYDGTYMYGGAAAGVIYEMDFASQTLVSSISNAGQARSIAYDSDNDAFWISNFGSDVWLISKAGATLNTIPNGNLGLAGMYGSAYDNTSGTPYLWIFDQGAGGGTAQLIHQVDLTTLMPTGFTYDVMNDLGPNASGIAGGLFMVDNVYPGVWSIGGLLQGTPDVFFMYEFAPASPAWVSISANAGNIDPGNTETMDVMFDATDLLPGVYEAEIHFSTDPDVGSPVVPVTMVVEGLIPPINLELSYDCTDMMMSWEMPAGGTPDGFNIYIDGELAGTSTGMEYTETMVDPDIEYSCYVTAVYDGEESLPTSTQLMTVPMPSDLQPLSLDGTAHVPDANNVTLTWNEPAGCLAPDGYNIYRDDEQVNPNLVTDLTYVDTVYVNGLYQYTVTAVYYFGESDMSTPKFILFMIDAINLENAGGVAIYPNPANDIIQIKSAAELSDLIIYSTDGTVVLQMADKFTNKDINVRQLEAGIYFIKVKLADDYVIRKLVVK